MTDTLRTELRKKVEKWENSWIDDTPADERAVMVEDVRRMADHNDPEITQLIELFESSLIEQAKYEDWRKRMDAAMRDPQAKAMLEKEREDALEPFKAIWRLDLAPDWLLKYFKPRHGPAMRCSQDM
jgi:hypothetical protein